MGSERKQEPPLVRYLDQFLSPTEKHTYWFARSKGVLSMKITMKVVAVFALVVAMFSPSGSVAAADVYKFKGNSASAYFSSTDPSGCIVTGGTVFVFETISHSPHGPGSSETDVLIDFFKYDQCTDTSLMSASNSAPAEIIEFDVAGNLDSVSLLA